MRIDNTKCPNNVALTDIIKNMPVESLKAIFIDIIQNGFVGDVCDECRGIVGKSATLKCENTFCCENNYHLLDGCMDHRRPEDCAYHNLFKEGRDLHQIMLPNCSEGDKDGDCCCNCASRWELMKHPWNEEFGKGKISEQCGYLCVVQYSDGSNRKRAVFSDRKHGMCELHTRGKAND